MMKKILFFALACFSGSVFASTDISGHYTCSGHDPYQNKDYSEGSLTVKKAGDVFDFAWSFTQLKLQSQGVGFFDPAHNSIISVAFKISNNQVGLVSYKVSGNQLIGQWAYLGKKQLGAETCKKAP